MAKQSDIVGTIRVPESDYGRFWNFMKSMPASEFTPTLHAEAPTPKRKNGKDAEGTSGKCIVLGALVAAAAPLKTKAIANAMEENGRSRHIGSLLDRLLKEKMVTRTKAGYNVTAAGRKFHETSCPVK